MGRPKKLPETVAEALLGRSVGERADAPLLPHAPADLAGRTADEPTIVRWVARNIDSVPDPATCPDPFAWTLLRECLETPGFVPDHFMPLWAKLIPPRSQLEQAGPKVQDGKLVIDLIDRITGHARAARGRPKKVATAQEPEPELEGGDV